MLNTPEIKNIYSEIQKKLYYMIPEKWDRLYLYASITEKAYQMPIGEMFFYYFPKGIIKKNAVNVYEIPSKFNINEKSYTKLVKDLYSSIEKLRNEFKINHHKLWTNITISIENFKFKIEYNYDNLEDENYTSYDRHIIWRFEHLDLEYEMYSKKERTIIEEYLKNKTDKQEKQNEEYTEPVYQKPIDNVFDYKKYRSIENYYEEIKTEEENSKENKKEDLKNKIEKLELKRKEKIKQLEKVKRLKNIKRARKINVANKKINIKKNEEEIKPINNQILFGINEDNNS